MDQLGEKPQTPYQHCKNFALNSTLFKWNENVFHLLDIVEWLKMLDVVVVGDDFLVSCVVDLVLKVVDVV